MRIKLDGFLYLALVAFLITVFSQASFSAAIDVAALAAHMCKSEPIPQRTTLDLQWVRGAKGWGPRLRIPASAEARSIDALDSLSIAQYNLDRMEEMHGSIVRPEETQKFYFDPSRGDKLGFQPSFRKSRQMIERLAGTLKLANPDVAVLQEVENIFVLQRFNEEYLKNRYKVILVPGNDTVNNIAFLVKKDLPFDLEVQSFRNVENEKGSRSLFYRDFPVMLLREKGAAAESKPLMAIAGAHYKSLLLKEGQTMSHLKGVRMEELNASAKIINAYQQKFGKDMPFFLAGDLNDDLSFAKDDFQTLWNTGLQDIFDFMDPALSVPEAQRITHSSHPPEKNAIYRQTDSISANRVVQKQGLLRAGSIVPYLDEAGRPRPLPRTIQERYLNASDHFMVWSKINFPRLLKLYRGGIVQ